MGADDARVMMKYFEPKFEEYDLVHMHNRHFVVSLTIEGEKAQAFSATTLDLPGQYVDQTERIVANSREKYAKNKSHIETYVRDRYLEPNERPRASEPRHRGHELAEQPHGQASHMTASNHTDLPAGQADSPKKKRRRRRKKSVGGEMPQTVVAPQDQDETIIDLR